MFHPFEMPIRANFKSGSRIILFPVPGRKSDQGRISASRLRHIAWTMGECMCSIWWGESGAVHEDNNDAMTITTTAGWFVLALRLTDSALSARLSALLASSSAFCTLISFSRYFFFSSSSLSLRLSTRRTLRSLVLRAWDVSVSIWNKSCAV